MHFSGRPCCWSACESFSHCVDFPARSRPSITMRPPRSIEGIILTDKMPVAENLYDTEKIPESSQASGLLARGLAAVNLVNSIKELKVFCCAGHPKTQVGNPLRMMRLPLTIPGLVGCLISLVSATALTYKLQPNEKACFFSYAEQKGLKLAFYFAVS